MKRIYHKQLWHKLGKANYDFQFVEDGDNIAVGLSGGKDSTALLYVMSEWQKFSPVRFNIQAITLDLGWNADYSILARYCAHLNIPYHIEKTDIKNVVFEIRKEKNPCSLCAKLRRGILNDTAKFLKCNKVALGHHLDDAIETLLLSMSFESRFDTFKPKSYLDKTGITVIRPLIYVEEKTLGKLVKKLDLPVVENPCPVDKFTKRQDMKNVVSYWQTFSPKLRENILGALRQNIWQS